MARPALVIGLGGTGQWVLTYLKRELIEAYLPDRGNPNLVREGGMPKGVRLLAFDTILQRVVKDENQTEVGGDVRHRRVGNVELDEGTEYIFSGGKIKSLVDIIWNKDHQNFRALEPHLWLKESFPSFPNLPMTVMNATDGAGAIRQVGRLAFIRNVRENLGVLGSIRSAIQGILDDLGANAIEAGNQNTPNYSKRLEVIFVTSLAGGTGAGMFIDLALWCRNIIDTQFPGATVFRAFLVTPFAFTSPGANVDRGKMARSFAAWRELDRFLNAGQMTRSGTIKYDGLDNTKQISLGNRLFDVTYMIDPNRENQPIPAAYPPHTLNASIAQAIAKILDQSAGGNFSEDALNYNADLAARKNTHCAIGAYTIKVPIYYHWQRFSTDLEQKTLETFLQPVYDNDQRPNGVRFDSNKEHAPADVGRAAAIKVLQSANINYQDQLILNTKFWQGVASCMKESWNVDDGKISTTALNFPKNGNWGPFGINGIKEDAALITHPVGQSLLDQWKRDFEDGKLWNWVPLSDKPAADFRTTPGLIDTQIQNHYSEDDGNAGSYKKSLQKAGEIQLDLFKDYIRAVLEQELNGTSSDALLAKCGKVGWVKYLLDELSKGLTDYQDFCTKVLGRAAESDITEKTARAAAARENEFRQHAGDQAWLTFWDNNTHPKAHAVERLYYHGKQSLANLAKERILFVQLRRTAKDASDFIDKTNEDLESWIKVLVTGGSQEIGQETVYTDSVLVESWNESRVNDDDYTKLDLNQVQTEQVGDVEYPEFSKEIELNLKAFNWTVAKGEGLRFGLSLDDESMDNGRDLKNDLAAGINRTHEVIHKKCEKPFINKITNTPPNAVFTEIVNQWAAKGGAGFAQAIQNKADPFWRLTAGGTGPYAPTYGNPRKGLIAFNQTNMDANEQNFNQAMITRLALQGTTNYSTPALHDPFTFTFVRTDNVISSEDFNVYQECKKAYLNAYLIGDAEGVKTNLEQFHIFPAEVHAAQYEREISRTLRLPFALLSPEVVLLLDDKKRVDNLFKAVALGIIRREMVEDDAGRKGYAWIYKLEDGPVTWLTELSQSPEPDADSYRYLINRTVYNGQDVRSNANTIVWDDLDTKIWNTELEHLSNEPYRSQYEINRDAKSRKELVDNAAKKVQNGEKGVVWPILADLALQNEKDLAHLCELAYRKANADNVKPDGQSVVG